MKKKLGSAAFLLLIFALTCRIVFKEANWGDILYWLKQADKRVLFPAFVIVPVFVSCEAVIYYHLYHKLGYKATILQCLKYAFVGFFFSYITPSSTGGQPAQLMYMAKDKKSISVSTFILLLITIVYKAVLVFLGAIILIFFRRRAGDVMGDAVFLLWFGVISNTAAVCVMTFLVFSRGAANGIVTSLLGFVEKLRIIRKNPERKQRILGKMERYHEAATYIRGNVHLLLWAFAVTLFQRVIWFLIPYLVYVSLGLRGASPAAVVMTQIMITISVDMLPFPGGMGISEKLFLDVYARYFGQAVLPAMLLSRGISFYFLLLLSGLISGGAALADRFFGKHRAA